jgi:hypothetical protein
MTLKKGDAANFQTLLRAAAEGALTLVESMDALTGEYRALLCATTFDGKEYTMVPFGHLCTGNPYEQYRDPTSPIQ